MSNTVRVVERDEEVLRINNLDVGDFGRIVGGNRDGHIVIGTFIRVESNTDEDLDVTAVDLTDGEKITWDSGFKYVPIFGSIRIETEDE